MHPARRVIPFVHTRESSRVLVPSSTLGDISRTLLFSKISLTAGAFSLASTSDAMPPPRSVIVAATVRMPVASIGIPVAVPIVIPLWIHCCLRNARCQHGECCESKPKNAKFLEHCQPPILFGWFPTVEVCFKGVLRAASLRRVGCRHLSLY